MQAIPYGEYRRKLRHGNVVITESGEPELAEEWDYEVEPDIDFTDEEELARKQQELIGVSPSRFTEFAVRIPDKKLQRHVPFSFEGREYLRLPYDTPAKRTLFKCGRQVEKSCAVSTICRLFDGSPIKAGDVKVGDWVATLSADSSHMTHGQVVWVSRRYTKPCVRIRTRQGHTSEVALTHPMRTWDSWTEAGNLSVGMKIAAVRRCGLFHQQWAPEKHRIRLTAYLIGDGCIGGNHRGVISFSQMPGPVLDEFCSDVALAGGTYHAIPDARGKAISVRLHENGSVRGWMQNDGLENSTSHSKFIPSWVWGLSKEDSALFLNRLWSTDGHVKQNTRSKYSIEYCSVSERLIRDVQSLLWKFGIPSSVRQFWPNYWKDQGIEEYAYVLRIETSEGVHRFLTDISCLGKSERCPVPEQQENNNRDTYPIEINGLIRKIIASRGQEKRRGCKADKAKSLRTAGLRETLKYPPTWRKLQQYVDFFKSDSRYDQRLVAELEKHVDTDLFWDEIEEITFIGEQECIDFEVEGTHNFVADGLVTHNSTLLGNRCLSFCCIINSFQVLYVSPTNLQTKTFSQDRLKEPVETSDVLKAWTTSKLQDNVFLKKFINRSQITLRYAYHNADRTRGIPSDQILIDEIQDIITDNIPVIEECASHSSFKFFNYSGTPKSFDNPLEHYWTNLSTQNEWVVPCEHHGVPGDPSTWHWNVLGEDNIGPTGLVCEKCRNLINPQHPLAQWASMNPEVRRKLADPFEGFRIPQLMVPWLEWHEILDKQTKYPRQKFYNEVLGMSYDSGTRPLTRQDVIDNCEPGMLMSPSHLRDTLNHIGQTSPVFAGIDWGCHDDQTRILTERGFVYFKDLMDVDRVAQWDQDTREMSFVVPEARTVRDWNQPLQHFEGKSLDMMLTHTHRMRVGVKSGSDLVWKTEHCEDVIKRGGAIRFVGVVDWKGEAEEFFTLPGLPTSPGYKGSQDRVILMDDWLEFLGYYLSEGGLCFNSDRRPSCLKMSQRETVNAETAAKMRACLNRVVMEDYSEFPNENTGDMNWTIYGKQFWHWVLNNVGERGDSKRIPRRFLRLPKMQLMVLFDAMMAGDGSTDAREGNDNGNYTSTSKGLCEDFQELCIRLGLRSTLSLHKPAEGNRKARWRVSWSSGRDFQFNDPKNHVKTVPYSGKVYCCKVPKGYIVTERNGRIAYQGNTGEGSYSVLSLGAYIRSKFTIFYIHRFEGPEIEPPVQLDLIEQLLKAWNVHMVGVDYGGGFDRNDALIRRFGGNRIVKYQYTTPSMKVKWEQDLKRFLVHRTEVMSDVFNAIKRRDVFRFPDWATFEDPFGKDMLNIFAEYNEQLRQIQYKKSPDCTDDSFHSILLCFLASILKIPRFDVLNPAAKTSLSSYDE